jgi:hypothetical protein
MAFPAIPTAPTQVAGLNQLNTTATLTGPNLNTLTKSAGDLLVAIAGEYQSNAGTDAAYTGWAGGGLTWTEIRDSTGTAVNRLGVAIARVVTGSETGTVTVTRSGTLVGDASMIVLVIPGAHATTDPEATVMATAANATPGAAPATLTPSWGAEDTLWIGVNGSGMTSATSTWLGTTGAPTNYTGYFDTAAADTSTIGDFDMAVAFRQLNAASETMAGFAVDATLNRTSALLIAVRPAPVTILDSPGLSLSSFGTFTGVGSGDTINYVRVGVTHHVASGGNAPTYELWDGTTAQIGTTQTGTTGTSDHTDTAAGHAAGPGLRACPHHDHRVRRLGVADGQLHRRRRADQDTRGQHRDHRLRHRGTRRRPHTGRPRRNHRLRRRSAGIRPAIRRPGRDH